MKAFVGKGVPAAADVSPDSAMRDRAKQPLTGGVPSLEIKQYFVPGSRNEVAVAFRRGKVTEVTKQGVDVFASW